MDRIDTETNLHAYDRLKLIQTNGLATHHEKRM